MLTDTAPEAAAAHLQMLRDAGTERRLAAVFRYSRSVIALSRAALRERHPELTPDEARLAWVAQTYGPELAEGVRRKLERIPCAAATTSTTR